jgi:hypothetical protein
LIYKNQKNLTYKYKRHLQILIKSQMKNTITNSKLLGLIISAIALFALSSCSKKMTFLSSSIVPAADGSVSIKNDKNENYAIAVSVNHLAPAPHLTPPEKTYVVWIVTEDNETKNIGQLQSSSGFMSKALKASLNAVTPFRPNYVFITAEKRGDVEYPGTLVLSTR